MIESKEWKPPHWRVASKKAMKEKALEVDLSRIFSPPEAPYKKLEEILTELTDDGVYSIKGGGSGDFFPVSRIPGIDMEPYVDHYKKAYGVWPILKLMAFKQLPVRYSDSKTGKNRYRMRPFSEGHLFQVKGLEAGKRASSLIVVEDMASRQELVLEPTLVRDYCHFGHDPDRAGLIETFDDDLPAAADPEIESIKEIVQERKKNARFII